MAPGKLVLPPRDDEELGVYQPPAAAEDRRNSKLPLRKYRSGEPEGIFAIQVRDQDADQGDSSPSSSECNWSSSPSCSSGSSSESQRSSTSSDDASGFKDGLLQFDDLDSYNEPGEDYKYEGGTEEEDGCDSDEAMPEVSDEAISEVSDEAMSEVSDDESDLESDPDDVLRRFDDELLIRNKETREKFLDAVFNLEKSRGRFCHWLEYLRTRRGLYGWFKNQVNSAIICYNKANQTHFKAGKILNCVSSGAGGMKSYLTFEATDSVTGTGFPMEFQAAVWDAAAGNRRAIFLVRLRSHARCEAK